MVVIDKNGDPRPTCINIGCDRLATSSGRRWTGKVRYRPYCGRCHQAAGGRKTYAEGVTPVKKDFWGFFNNSKVFGSKIALFYHFLD